MNDLVYRVKCVGNQRYVTAAVDNRYLTPIQKYRGNKFEFPAFIGNSVKYISYQFDTEGEE